ncbi:WD40 repeat domain-containing protein [Streptomyces formicae]|uniref:HTH cro/C1-type domain-containing protein n=1 Tax=Streptomyces formicae TaxID=1616117 RepID=A0A291QMI3_9ACTN|nr:WD40 repeat domain-containing protein [Streptomyces formicae]ATL32768.1 hypothetical protein KY5_7750 [Streptomyces formicae]
MGRQEKPIDPAAGPVPRFALDLRKLRQEAGGLPYRAMSQRANYSVTALSQAAAGESLPSLEVTLAYVRACGGDPSEWEQRWHQASREQDLQKSPGREENGPYPGLTRFEPGDRDCFFGRQELTDTLVQLVLAHRITAVLGPSGSGKSSLLRAGLVPRLQHLPEAVTRPVAIRIFTPGPRPLHTHRDRFIPAPGQGETWLIVDQFEELFTLHPAPEEQAAFINLLLSAREADSRLRIVLGVRADFYGRCLEHEGLAAVIRQASLPVGPMTDGELREAIVKPAAVAGLIVERALTERLIAEVREEPGGLPLLSHALLETWRRRRGRALTLHAYEAAGGIHGAIAQTAEDLYAALSTDQRITARRILLRLITPGQGAPDTRCPVNRSALQGRTTDAGETDTVLDRLTRARLVTLDEDTVDLAHEALITAWPRLGAWLNEDRERLLLHRRLRQDTQTWEELGKDSGSLYRGVRLAEAEEAFDGTAAGELALAEAEFLAAGRAARARELRRRRSSTAFVAAIVVLSLIVGVVAWQQNREGDQRRAEATSRRLASLAENMRATDPRTAMRLSAAAWRIKPTDEAKAALLGATTQREQDAFALPSGRDNDTVSLSKDGRTITAASEAGRRVDAWDVASHRRIGGFRLSEGERPAGLTPDGRQLLMRGEYGWRVRDLSSGKSIGASVVDLHVEEEDLSSTLSGRMVLMEGATSVRLWDLRQGRMVFQRKGADIGSVAVSRDDRHLALCDGQSLKVWDVGPQHRLRTLRAALSRAACRSDSQLRFDPQGRLLTVGENIRGYDLGTGRKVLQVEHEGPLNDVEFSSDGRLAVAVDSEAILLWRVLADGYELVHQFRLSGESVQDLRLDPEQRMIRYLEGDDGAITSVRTLFLGDAVASWSRASVGAAFSPDGTQLLTARDERGRARFEVRPTAGGGRAVTLPSADCHPSEDSWDFWCWPSLAFSGDGRWLAYGAVALDREGFLLRPQQIKVWDLRKNRRRADFVIGAKGYGAQSIALNTQGTSLLALRQEPEPALVTWNVRNGTKTVHPVWDDADPQDWSDYQMSPGSGAVAMRPDGRRLATVFGTLALPSGRRAKDASGPLVTNALAYPPDGGQLAVGEGTGRVTLYDGDATRRTASLPGTHSGLDSELESADALAYSHDGKILAVGGDEGTVRLWDAASGRPLGGPLPSAGDAVKAVAFSEDDKTVLVAGGNVPLRSYAIDPERATETVCDRARGGLSRADWEAYIPDVPYHGIC